ncbi:MAG: hypothetical protein HZA04_01810 [Nitrospinae bacterium]|nr:hypothetical protein [Nitrospinota bacterium]
MNKCLAFIVVALAVLLPVSAESLTLQQENLIGLPNRFAVSVAQFDGDGELTAGAVKKSVEDWLTASRLSVVEKRSAPPLSFINVAIARQDGPEGKVYLLDVNVYSHATITTTYRLRKGTVWMMGSEKVVAGKDFPADVLGRLGTMVNFFIRDYRASNPPEARQE